MRNTLRNGWLVLEPILSFLICASLVQIAFGSGGIFPEAFSENAGWKVAAYVILMCHVTITAMSLCFHRAHTHQGVKLHPFVDKGMQIWLGSRPACRNATGFPSTSTTTRIPIRHSIRIARSKRVWARSSFSESRDT